MASPKGHTQHQAENVESGKFVFTAVEDGDYTTCFIAPVFKPPAKFAVDFEWKSGVEAKDWATIAKRGQINVQNYIYLILAYFLKPCHIVSSLI